MSSFKNKLLISLLSSSIFLLVSLPNTYKLLFNNNCPTNNSRLIHTLIFSTISFLTMIGSKTDNGVKLKHTIYGTLIYYFISSPELYSLTTSNYNCPKLLNIIIHTVFYCLALIGVMYLPEKNN